ncbi:RimJ/RimL family protein N-acetyltransferase [Pantoea sp. PNA 14-12]|uniref:GNAT family N-acetyltransferase n=1 Tax=Pantoea TaxID=53335 RepID=UPI00050F6DD2|nr:MULTISPECIES: GNAT family protein [Pantoea]KGD83194.1 acetyltransferase [Pantoea stewartii subsp. indologenes]TDS69244.1 RimJ/RimL family protein N-acetyltransferase [Pantoea sp. PNA 14-12]
MAQHLNQYGQPVGQSMPDWQSRPLPQREIFQGQVCRLEPFSVAAHGAALWQAWSLAEDGRDWTYLSDGPCDDEAAWLAHARTMEASRDPLHFSVVDRKTDRAVGTLSLMRIDAANGVMEVGFVTFSRLLRQTRMATEAHFLLMRYAFEQLGYRRYEWKCDSCNLPSRRAALRLGFQFEGDFRQARIYKGRTRDTSWFSIIDSEWPQVKAGFERWLAETNFTREGQQREKLETLRG